MGTAFVEIHVSLRDRLMSIPALADLVRVLNPEAKPDGDGRVFAKVSSPLLPAGENGHQDIIIEGLKIRFKRWEPLWDD